jgi:putative cardiolipin synthase
MKRFFLTVFLILHVSAAHAQQATLLEADRHAIQARLDLVMSDDYKDLKITTFILGDDQASRLYLAALGQALDQGKRVRLIVDPYQSFFPWAYLDLLKQKGLELRIYNDLQKWDWINPWKAFQKMNERMHDKLMIFDQKILITGGRNVNQDYFLTMRARHAKDGYFPFRDKDIWIEGKVAADAGVYFEELWKNRKVTEPRWPVITKEQTETAKKELEHYTQIVRKVTRSKTIPRPEPAIEAEFVSNEADKNDRVGSRLVQEIDRAQTEILIENPYIVLTKPMKRAFLAAAARGVRVVVFTNSPDKGDEGLVAQAFGQDAPELIEAGIEFYQLANRNYLHSKTAVFDRKVVFIGSFNLDNRSENINRESGVILKDPAFGEVMVAAAEKTKGLSTLLRYQGIEQKIRCDALFGPGLGVPRQIQKLNLKEKVKLMIARPFL